MIDGQSEFDQAAREAQRQKNREEALARYMDIVDILKHGELVPTGETIVLPDGREVKRKELKQLPTAEEVQQMVANEEKWEELIALAIHYLQMTQELSSLSRIHNNFGKEMGDLSEDQMRIAMYMGDEAQTKLNRLAVSAQNIVQLRRAQSTIRQMANGDFSDIDDENWQYGDILPQHLKD